MRNIRDGPEVSLCVAEPNKTWATQYTRSVLGDAEEAIGTRARDRRECVVNGVRAAGDGERTP
jgi:hypothetical protein